MYEHAADKMAAVKSAGRVLDLLEHIAQSDGDLSHSDLAAALSIPKSSLTQLLKNLIARDYVTFAPELRCYRLGPALFNLTRKAGAARSLVEESQVILANLTQQLGESSALNIREGWESKIAATCLGPSRLVTHMRLGDVAPLYATSGGKVILAYMPDALRIEYLEQIELRPITENTISEIGILQEQIAEVRLTGFAYVNSEYTPGIVGVAAPVLNIRGTLLGALSVAVPQVRFDDKVKLAAERGLRLASAALEKRLNFPAAEVAGEDVAKPLTKDAAK